MPKQKTPKAKDDVAKIDPLNVTDDDPQVGDFYAEKQRQAETLWKNGAHKQAIAILKEELDQPYIPLPYLETFGDLLLDWEASLKVEAMRDVTIPQLLTKAVSGEGRFEPEVFEALMHQNPDQLLNPANQALMEAYLQGDDDNVNKIFALDVMGQHAIDHEFTFKNTYSGVTASLNPMLFTSTFQTPEQNQSILKVNELTDKDPSLNKFAIDLLLQTFIYYYPEFPFPDVDDLAAVIVDDVRAMLGTISWPETSSKTAELVDKVLENLREIEANKQLIN